MQGHCRLNHTLAEDDHILRVKSFVCTSSITSTWSDVRSSPRETEARPLTPPIPSSRQSLPAKQNLTPHNLEILNREVETADRQNNLTKTALLEHWDTARRNYEALKTLHEIERRDGIDPQELEAYAGFIDAHWIKLILEIDRCLDHFKFETLLWQDRSILRVYLHGVKGTVQDIFHVVSWAFKASNEGSFCRIEYTLKLSERGAWQESGKVRMQLAVEEVSRNPTMFKEWRWRPEAQNNLRLQGPSYPRSFRSVPLEPEHVPELEYVSEPGPASDRPGQELDAPEEDGEVPDLATECSRSSLVSVNGTEGGAEEDSQSIVMIEAAVTDPWSVVSSKASEWELLSVPPGGGTVSVGDREPAVSDLKDIDFEILSNHLKERARRKSERMAAQNSTLGSDTRPGAYTKDAEFPLEDAWNAYFEWSQVPLENWQRMMEDLGQDGDFTSVKQCKMVY